MKDKQVDVSLCRLIFTRDLGEFELHEFRKIINQTLIFIYQWLIIVHAEYLSIRQLIMVSKFKLTMV